MTSPGVVVPAVPPQPPQLTLVKSSVRPGLESDPPNPVFQVGDSQLAGLPDDLVKELRAQARDSWTRGITYAPENHFTAEVRDACDFTSIDGPALAAPLGVTLTQGAGGNLANGTYAYEVTATDANGETTALPAVTINVSAGANKASVTVTWNKDGDAYGYNIYGRVAGQIGLLASPGPFDDDQSASWTDTGAASVGATPPSTNSTGGPGAYANLPIVSYTPFLIVVEDSCSAFGFSERDFKGRASRLLDAATPQALEREFWTGALAQAKGYANNYLTNNAAPGYVDLTPAGGAPSVARGQQLLQDYLATNGFGGQGMIHCQPQTAPNLLNARRVGPLLLDMFDNIIVPGVGYPGTDSHIGTPAVNTAVMFATDLVQTRTEDEGTVFPDTFAEALDWGQGGAPNTIRFRAMRFGAAYWDGAIQAGVRVTLET